MEKVVLELFAGSRSLGKVCDEKGIQVYSIDINDFDNIDFVQDIEFLTPDMIPITPTIIWGSIPCTTYSIAGISSHRDNQEPVSDFAKKSDRLAINTLKLIKYYGCAFYLENPVGMLRKMDFMRGLDRTTITYCSYGDDRMKPTDIWSNNINDIFNPYGWLPRPMCYNGNKKCHHEAAPRGSKTGTQGRKNNYERSKVPKELFIDILDR